MIVLLTMRRSGYSYAVVARQSTSGLDIEYIDGQPATSYPTLTKVLTEWLLNDPPSRFSHR